MPRGAGLDTTAGANYGLESANNYVTYASLVPEAVNTFTVELWVNPYYTHEIDPESNTGYGGESGQRFILFPVYGGDPETGKAGMGISVGTNGISVYEHAGNYIPPLLVWQGTVSGWTHIAVVYDNKTPKLYVNGVLVHTGLTSLKSFIYPGTVFPGGQYGNTAGAQMDEVRIWDVARTQAQIQAGMSTEVPGNSEHLVAYWPMNEGSGTVLHDVTGHGHDVSLFQGGYPTSYWVSGALSLEHLSVGAYRYGFNGKEKDGDIGEDDYDYGMRIHDARLGRFLSVDPITKKYPELTPYQFASNSPVVGIDLDGLEFMKYDEKFKSTIVFPRNEYNSDVIIKIQFQYALQAHMNVLVAGSISEINKFLGEKNNKYSNLLFTGHGGFNISSLKIGNYGYNASSMKDYATDIKKMGSYLNKDGSIILLACFQTTPKYEEKGFKYYDELLNIKLDGETLTKKLSELTNKKVVGTAGETYSGYFQFSGNYVQNYVAKDKYLHDLSLRFAGHWSITNPDGTIKLIGPIILNPDGSYKLSPKPKKASNASANEKN